MNSIPFFTPVYYGKHAQSLGHTILEKVDDFFFLGDCCNFSGRKAHVLPGFATIGKSEGALYKKHISSYIATAAKMGAYCTVVIPIIALVVKACLRYVYHFHLIETDAGKISDEAIRVKESDALLTAKLLSPKWGNILEIPNLQIGQQYNLSADEVMALKIRIGQETVPFLGARGPEEGFRIGFSNLRDYIGSYFEVKVHGSDLLEDARFAVERKKIIYG